MLLLGAVGGCGAVDASGVEGVRASLTALIGAACLLSDMEDSSTTRLVLGQLVDRVVDATCFDHYCALMDDDGILAFGEVSPVSTAPGSLHYALMSADDRIANWYRSGIEQGMF